MFKKMIMLYKFYFWSCEKYARHEGVTIGKGCWIATRNFGSEPYLVEIGDHVQITADVKFFTHGAAWVYRKEYPNMDYFGKIKVGNNVYIGNNALLMPGVEIGNNVIIAAGAVVTKSVESGSIVAGNPARGIGEVAEFKNKILEFDLGINNMDKKNKKTFLLKQSDDKFIRK